MQLQCFQKKKKWKKKKKIWFRKLKKPPSKVAHNQPQNSDSPLIGQSFWQKNSFITHILFELCLFWYLAQSTYLWDTLYWPGCHNGLETEIPYHQKPHNAGLGI